MRETLWPPPCVQVARMERVLASLATLAIMVTCITVVSAVLRMCEP